MAFSRSKVTNGLMAFGGAVSAFTLACQMAPDWGVQIPPVVGLIAALAIVVATSLNDAIIKFWDGTAGGWIAVVGATATALPAALGAFDKRYGFVALAIGMVLAAISGPLAKSSGQQVIEAQKTMSPQQVVNAVASFRADNQPVESSAVVEHVTQPTGAGRTGTAFTGE